MLLLRFRDSAWSFSVSTFPDAMVVPLVDKKFNFLLDDWSKTEPYRFPEIQEVISVCTIIIVTTIHTGDEAESHQNHHVSVNPA